MMEINLYTIYDTVAVEAGPPFTAKNDKVAWRNYIQVISQAKAPMEELCLYRIGSFDPEIMLIKGDAPEMVEPSIELVEDKNE